MRRLSRGRRSSLYKEGDVVYRHFHDTGVFTVVPTRIDARGIRRYENNCTEASLADAANRWPPYLRRAKAFLLASKSIDEVSQRCGVQRSTAWQYVTKVCAASPDAAQHVLVNTTLICPELEGAAASIDLSGTLSEVMTRLEEQLHGNIAWRCAEDRFSQLRLLRVCLESANAARTSSDHAAV